MMTGAVTHRNKPWRRLTVEENIEIIPQIFTSSPKSSTPKAFLEIGLKRTTVNMNVGKIIGLGKHKVKGFCSECKVAVGEMRC